MAETNYISPKININDKHSKVYIITHKITQKKLIVKIFESKRFIFYQHEKEILDYININKQNFEHKNNFFIMYKEINYNSNMFKIPTEIKENNLSFLFYDYLSKLSLFDYINNSKEKIKEIHAKYLCIELLFLIKNLHKINICQNNINISNIMFDDNFDPKIIHYSESKFINNDNNLIIKDIYDIGKTLAKIVTKGIFQSIGYSTKKKSYEIFSIYQKQPLADSLFWELIKNKNIDISKQFLEFFYLIINAKKDKKFLNVDELFNNEWLFEIKNNLILYQNNFKNDFEQMYKIIIENKEIDNMFTIDLDKILDNEPKIKHISLFEEEIIKSSLCQDDYLSGDQLSMEENINMANIYSKNNNNIINNNYNQINNNVINQNFNNNMAYNVFNQMNNNMYNRNLNYNPMNNNSNNYNSNHNNFNNNSFDRWNSNINNNNFTNTFNQMNNISYNKNSNNNSFNQWNSNINNNNLNNTFNQINNNSNDNNFNNNTFNRWNNNINNNNLNNTFNQVNNNINNPNFNYNIMNNNLNSINNNIFINTKNEFQTNGGGINQNNNNMINMNNTNIYSCKDKENISTLKKSELNYLLILINNNNQNNNIKNALNNIIQSFKKEILNYYSSLDNIKINIEKETNTSFDIMYQINPVKLYNDDEESDLIFLDEDFEQNIKSGKKFYIKFKIIEDAKNNSLHSFMNNTYQYYFIFNGFNLDKEEFNEHVTILKNIVKDILKRRRNC